MERRSSESISIFSMLSPEQIDLIAQVEESGIVNSAIFHNLAEIAFKNTVEAGYSASILFEDLDNLKSINDVYGHKAGDEAIEAVSTGLRLNRFDLIGFGGRAGGDEFKVFFVGDIEDAEQFRRRLIAHFIENFVEIHPELVELDVGLSVGISSTSDINATSVSELLQAADKDMYEYRNANLPKPNFRQRLGNKILDLGRRIAGYNSLRQAIKYQSRRIAK